MEQINAYYQVEVNPNGSICHIFSPKEGGAKLEYKTVAALLNNHGYNDFDAKGMNDILVAGGSGAFPIGIGDGLEFSGSMEVSIAEDNMTATCVVYPPSKNGSNVNIGDITASLAQAGVKYGIDQEKILEFNKKPVYFTPIVMAKGLAPVQGKDASIEYFFDTNLNIKPAHNEDGSVDYHNLNMVCEVQENQLLARLTMEEKGKPGKNVRGLDIPPRNVNARRLQYGKNIRINDEKTEIFSEVNGHVRLYGEQVFVSDVYEVPADVDNSIGNIDYQGSVYVRGTIREGFVVMAGGDVIVDGSVEGALVQAGGQIIIKRGINGMNKGVLEAGGNVTCKFIENAKVFSGGYVETGSILHSQVSATTEVVVSDRKGFITGGMVRAGSRIEAQTIGSSMGATTRVEVGIDPEKKAQFINLQQELSAKKAEIEKVTPVINNYKEVINSGRELDAKNKMYYIKLLNTLKALKEEFEESSKEYQALVVEIGKSRIAKISVLRDIYPGVTVSISDVTYTMKDKRSFCTIEKRNGEIVFLTL